MVAAQRREIIRETLLNTDTPISASTLAAQLGVSRQVVVGDVALLRAGGFAIDATPRGYLVHTSDTGYTGLVACVHSTTEDLCRELYLVVDNGGSIKDVSVENPLYGELHANLHIANRHDADAFLKQAGNQPQSLLSSMTNGVHLHNINCPDKETFDAICNALRQAGILYQK